MKNKEILNRVLKIRLNHAVVNTPGWPFARFNDLSFEMAGGRLDDGGMQELNQLISYGESRATHLDNLKSGTLPSGSPGPRVADYWQP